MKYSNRGTGIQWNSSTTTIYQYHSSTIIKQTILSYDECCESQGGSSLPLKQIGYFLCHLFYFSSIKALYFKIKTLIL